MTDTTDIHVINHGSIIGFEPQTDAGEEWLSDNLGDDTQCLGLTRFCEPRYAGDIVEGMVNDGLTVA